MKFYFLLSLFLLISCYSKSAQKQQSQQDRRTANTEGLKRYFEVYGHNVPLHDLEEIPTGESSAIESLNKIMLGLFKNEYGQGATKDEPTGMLVQGTRRGVHPRSHGCVEGTLSVRNDLKHQAGIFQAGASYPITARFSNGSPKISADDTSVDTRGFAMKVHKVPGTPLLKESLGLGEEASQDFTLNSSEPFFADTAMRYSQFMQILTFEAPTLAEAGSMFIKKLLFDGHPVIAARVTKAFLAIQNVKTTTPLGIRYYSILPFQYGSGSSAPIVKYKMEPCQGVFDEPVDNNSKLFLRANLKKRMAQEGACFRLMVQERVKSSWGIEDGTQAWPERTAPYIEIATISFPAQELMNETQCEHLVINPWNTLPEHKPVGGINRIRLPTYLLSVRQRRATNHY